MRCEPSNPFLKMNGILSVGIDFKYSKAKEEFNRRDFQHRSNSYKLLGIGGIVSLKIVDLTTSLGGDTLSLKVDGIFSFERVSIEKFPFGRLGVSDLIDDST